MPFYDLSSLENYAVLAFVVSIYFPMRFHSVGFRTANQTQSATPIGYAEHRSRSHDAVIRVYDAQGNVIETHENAGELAQRAVSLYSHHRRNSR